MAWRRTAYPPLYTLPTSSRMTLSGIRMSSLFPTSASFIIVSAREGSIRTKVNTGCGSWVLRAQPSAVLRSGASPRKFSPATRILSCSVSPYPPRSTFSRKRLQCSATGKPCSQSPDHSCDSPQQSVWVSLAFRRFPHPLRGGAGAPFGQRRHILRP